MKIVGLILCGGSGKRTGLEYNKVLHYFGKQTALELCIDTMRNAGIQRIAVGSSQKDFEQISAIAKAKNVEVYLGGDTRFETSYLGLKHIGQCEIVVIHDGARPFADAEVFERVISSAQKYSSGIAAVGCIDTVKQASGTKIIKTLDRNALYNIQTPQAFDYAKLFSAYESADKTKKYYDDSEVFESAGFASYLVEGSNANIKITLKDDLFQSPKGLKIGTGFDVHKLVSGRKLILGGESIEHTLGLLGHSDADVLVHAIMDALLSAAQLPDIGILFPDTDDGYKNISSLMLLQRVHSLLSDKHYFINNISAVIICEKPKLSDYLPKMCQNIASVLKINTDKINISATTSEGLGVVGEQKGIAASAICTLFTIC